MLALLCLTAWADPGPTFTPFGRVFLRPELTENLADANGQANDAGWIFTLRTHLGVTAALPGDVDVVLDATSYGQYQLARAEGPLDPTLRLYQGYVAVRGLGRTPIDLHFGRMALDTYGTGLVIAADDFYDGFSLDGLRLRYDTAAATVDWIGLQLYADLDATATEDWAKPVLTGVHATVRPLPALHADAAAYWVVSRPWQTVRGQTAVLTVRPFGAVGPVHYTAEAVWQRGAGSPLVGGGPSVQVAAYAVDPRVGVTAGPVRVEAAYFRASGDADPADDALTSFNPLWQDPHGRLGNLDRFVASNVQREALDATLALAPGAQAAAITARGYALQVVAPGDPTGGIAPPPGPVDGDGIGIGGDAVLRATVGPHLTVEVDLSALRPGRYLAAALGGTDALFRGYIWADARF